jgi:hypothetical protein
MNRRSRLAWSALAVAGLLAVPAVAADSPLDQRISIELADADPQASLRTFSQLTGLRFDIPAGLHNKLTTGLHNVRVRTALDVVCESVGCTWAEVPGNPPSVRVELAPDVKQVAAPAPKAQPGLTEPISLDLMDADAKDVFKSFGQIANAKLDLASEVGGKVSLHLKAVPVRDAIDGVCSQIGCTWSIDPPASPGAEPVLRVRKKP